MKIVYTIPEESGVSIVVVSSKESVEKILGSLSDAEWETHIRLASIPQKAVNVRLVSDIDIPINREFRSAWCDTQEGTQIDIDCSKAKEIGLERLRAERDKLLAKSDVDYIVALSQGEDTAAVLEDKITLRAMTDPLKALNTAGKYNDEALLTSIRNLSKVGVAGG